MPRTSASPLDSREVLIAILGLLIIFPYTTSFAQQAIYSPGELAPIAAENSSNPSRLQASVGGGRYALALNNADARAGVAADEKLFILTLSILNESGPPREITKDTLEILITDRRARTHNDYIRLRHAGTDEAVDDTLMPGRTMVVDAVIRVPLSADVVEAYISDASHGEAPGPRFRFDTERSLPRDISPDGITIEPSVPGKLGVWYPLGGTDIQIIGYSYAEERLGSYIPSETTDILMIEFLARNRLNENLDIRSAIYRNSAVLLPGIRANVRDVWMRDYDQSVSWTTRPGEVLPLRVMMKVAKGLEPDTIHFVEHMGPRGGLSSRTYEIDLSATGDDPDAIQADGGAVIRPPAPGNNSSLARPVSTSLDLDTSAPATIDPGVMNTEQLPQLDPNLDDLRDLPEHPRIGVVVRLGDLPSGAVSTGAFRARNEVTFAMYGGPSGGSCEIESVELILLRKRQDPMFVRNTGARFADVTQRMINGLIPGDIISIPSVQLSCDESVNESELNISGAVYILK